MEVLGPTCTCLGVHMYRLYVSSRCSSSLRTVIGQPDRSLTAFGPSLIHLRIGGAQPKTQEGE
jgi:hypothetical protein